MKIDPQTLVTRLYLDFFHRLPDDSGDKFWIDQEYSQGKDEQHVLRKSIDVARAFFVAYEPDIFDGNTNLKPGCNERFVKLCYVKLLGRNPDAEGYASWLDEMAAHYGNPAPQKGVNHLIGAFITSDEYQMRLADTVTPTIPEPSGKVVRVSELNPRHTLTERIPEADRIIGNGKQGAIIVDVEGELLAPRTDIGDGHALYFTPGTWDFRTGRDDYPFVHGDESSLFGAGIDKTIFLEPEFGYTMISARGLLERDQGIDFVGVTVGLQIAGFTVQGGRQKIGEGGARSTIGFGNARNGRIWSVKLKDTSCLGVTFGGASQTGNFADGNIGQDLWFEGVGSQNTAIVNGKYNIFRRCSYTRPGKVGWAFIAIVDLEPNIPEDWMIDNVLEDQWIDCSDAALRPGCNGIVIQRGGAIDENIRGNIIRRASIIGLRPEQNGIIGMGLANGIYYLGKGSGSIFDCEITSAGQYGLSLEDSENIDVSYLTLNSCGWDVQKAMQIYNSTGCRFDNIKTAIAPGLPFGRTEIVETGTSDNNTFKNSPSVVLAGENSKIES